MTAQRWIGFALVALQVALLSFVFHDMLVPLLAGAVALVGLFRPLRLHLTIERRVFCALVLAVAMAAKWRLLPYVPRDNLIMERGLGVGLAQYLLVLQASLFHLEFPARKEPLALPKTLPAYVAAVLTCAGDVAARGIEINAYQAAAFAFLLLSVLYISLSDGYSLSPRRFPVRALIGVFLLLIVSGIAWGSAWFLGTNRQRIDEIFLAPFANAFAPAQGVGFSGSARLGSINHVKNSSEDKPALRVMAASEPGYLRGRAFTTFNGEEWEPEPAERAVPSNAALPVDPPRTREAPANAFRLQPGEGPWNLYEVWTAADFPVAFAPLGTGILAAATDTLKVSDSGIAEGPSLGQYAAYVSQAAPVPVELAGERRERYTAVPRNLGPEVDALAAKLFRKCRTVSDKIDAVERYFHTEYQYDMGIQIPPGENPLRYFLLNKPAAHCEYFASGATALLRLGGVPCRYVTGFVASERNAYGGYWVARNRDAHAWVEAFDDATGWRTVEATPATGVPQPREARNEWLDNLRFRLREFWTMDVRTMLRTVLGMLLRLLIPVGIISALLVALWGLWRRIRTQGFSGILRRKGSDDALLALLARMDAAVAGRGYRRERAETLHRFAGRLAGVDHDFFLKSASNWYLAYAATRYGNPLNSAAHELLRRQGSDLFELSRKMGRTKEG